MLNRYIMKKILLLTGILAGLYGHAQVIVTSDGSQPHTSAMLEVKSGSKGFLAPRMTLAERPLSPATGLLIYQTDVNPGFYVFTGSDWQRVGLSSDNYWLPNGANIFYSSGKVGIGTTNPEGNGLSVVNSLPGKAAIHGMEGSPSSLNHAEGQLGVLNHPSNILGLPLYVNNIGVLGIKRPSVYPGAAVYGWNSDVNLLNYGGIFIAGGQGSGNVNYGLLGYSKNAGTNCGIYAVADSGATNYAGRFKGRLLLESHTQNSAASDHASTLLSSKVLHTASSDTRAIEGISSPQPGWGIGIYGMGGYKGVEGYADGSNSQYPVYGLYANAGGATGGQGARTGVYGSASSGPTNYGVWGTSGFGTTCYGVYGASGYGTTCYGIYGNASGSGTNYGVFGTAAGGTGNWAGFFSGSAYISDDLRIGTQSKATGYALSVNGMIACSEVLVQEQANWPDYVFADGYRLLSLEEIDRSIKENKHLPGIPSAEEIRTDGVRVAGMQVKLLEKIEELTLHLIRQDRIIRELQEQVSCLKTDAEKKNIQQPDNRRSK